MSKFWYLVTITLLASITLVTANAWLTSEQSALAQTNLLTNGSLERPYYGQGGPTQTVPQGWNLWIGAGSPTAFPHTDKVQVINGEVSWNLRQGYTVFTAAGYQQVGGITVGDNYKLTANAWVYTCNDTTNSCIIPDPPYRRSDPAAGASVKVGIDPTGGTNPLSADVIWGPGAAPYDQWANLSVVAEAEAPTITVFLYMSQSTGLAINNVYWDNAALVNTDEEPAAGGDGTSAPPPAEVPFVVPQGVRPDGSIVHVVQEGDTLSSIAYAYSQDYDVTIESIAAVNDNIQPNTRFLQLGQEIIILPPGSVDPATGQLLSGTPLPAASGTPAAETPTGETPAPPVEPTEDGAAAPGPDATLPPTPTPSDITPTPMKAGMVPTPTGGGAPDPAVTGDAVGSGVDQPTAASTTQTATEAVESTASPDLATEPPDAAAPESAPPDATAVAALPAGAGESALMVRTGTLCVQVFEDANTNGRQDPDEPFLTGSQITLMQPDSAAVSHDITDAAAPLCVDIDPGAYDLQAALPDGYGPTTTTTAFVRLAAGQSVSVAVGGAPGYTPPAMADTATETAAETTDTLDTGAIAPIVEVVVDDESDDDPLDRIADNIGLFVLGFAGVVLVSGAILIVGLRRVTR